MDTAQHTMSPPPQPRVHTDCYHCGLPVDDPREFTLTITEQQQSFCCPGCLAVAGVIHQGGLDNFYRYRSELNRRPDQTQDTFALYDRDDIQSTFVMDHDNGEKTAYLLLDDITCAACVWLIEKHLRDIKGVVSIRVNAVNHRCELRWDTGKVALSQLLLALMAIGYRPQPLNDNNQAEQQQASQRKALMRLAVAAFGMMQVSMFAIALHAGALQGMDLQWQSFFRWVSLLVATPVVLFSAQPFWWVAWKNLKKKHITMEVPVALAIVLAYSASAWATFTGSGEVYFDSVSMFTFFLLLGKYLELRARFRNNQQLSHTTQLLPLVARRLDDRANDVTSEVLLSELKVNDRIRIYAGETIPCDGVIDEGSSQLIEAFITGESEPMTKTVGDPVMAGAVNTEGSLTIRTTAVNQQTRLSTIEQLTDFAQQDKPKIQELADHIARYFVMAVLIVASIVFTGWWLYEPESALWVTLSVLVVTCPCALSLATPTVLTVTTSKLRSLGLLVVKGHVIETLTKVSLSVFDKTGTLTCGKPAVVEVVNLDQSFSESSILGIAACLEKGSSHPIAHAFSEYQSTYTGKNRVLKTAQGVEGQVLIDGKLKQFMLGKPQWVQETLSPPKPGQWLLMASVEPEGEIKPLAWIALSDQVRQSSKESISLLNQQGIQTEILSGDNESVVKNIAQQLSVSDYQAGVSPEDKLARIRQYQTQGQTVLMAGDGINDVPVLAGADISVAMASATDLARTHADTVLLNDDLTVLSKAIKTAYRCQQIMRQNIIWALLYNVLALPLAALGFIPPYLAAIGMSLSSLLVVCNALRAGK